MQDIPTQSRDHQGNTQPKEDRYNKTSPALLSQRFRTHLPKASYHTHHPTKCFPKALPQAGNNHKHHITRTPSRAAMHEPQSLNCHNRNLKQEEQAKKTQRSTGRFPFKPNRGWFKINSLAAASS